jgi:hypothetical protein
MSRISILAATLVAATGIAGAAQAQVNTAVPGPYGAEDGYNDDGFGWGPAYRPETNFRPAYGFYGGVERPYPYGSQTGAGFDEGDDDVVAPAQQRRSRAVRTTQRNRATRVAPQRRQVDEDE